MSTITLLTRDALQHAQDQQSQHFNETKKLRTFSVGDKILVDIPFLQSAAERLRPKAKLRFKRLGPFTITAVLNENAYRLDLPVNIRAQRVPPRTPYTVQYTQ